VIVIPCELGYGDEGTEVIPGGATLLFDVELIKVQHQTKGK
jgi:FKBP-type peptidyl-prolyl cis-trans isomerase